MNSKENTLTQLQYAEDKGFPGTVLYSYRSCNSTGASQHDTFDFLTEKFQPAWTAAPLLPWKAKRGIAKGTVSRRGTGLPVYNATVALLSQPSRSLNTEPHGKYAFFNLEPGPCKLTAHAPGLVSESRSISVRAGEVLTLDFKLSNE